MNLWNEFPSHITLCVATGHNEFKRITPESNSRMTDDDGDVSERMGKESF